MKQLIVFVIVTFFIGSAHARSWSTRPIPAYLAEPAVLAAQSVFPDDKAAREHFIGAYCEAFLDVWRYGKRIDKVGRAFSAEAYDHGYRVGLKASREDLSYAVISPADFGYVLKTLKGLYKADFEKSEFVVADIDERFHLHHGRVEHFPSGEYEITAWVSPESSLGFGHFGQWKREIIVMSALVSGDTANRKDN